MPIIKFDLNKQTGETKLNHLKKYVHIETHLTLHSNEVLWKYLIHFHLIIPKWYFTVTS